MEFIQAGLTRATGAGGGEGRGGRSFRALLGSCPLGFPAPQVALLRAQLALERKQKQDYIARSVQTSRELAGLHHSLSHSLLAVAQAPEATVLEAETRKLDESLTQSLTSPGPILLCPSPSPAQGASR